jgi:hypothetical protein
MTSTKAERKYDQFYALALILAKECIELHVYGPISGPKFGTTDKTIGYTNEVYSLMFKELACHAHSASYS